MTELAVPTPIPEDTTNVGGLVVDRGRLRSWLRASLVVVIAMMLAGDVYIYSLYQSERSRVEALYHRVERLETMVVDALASNQNAIMVESLGQKVEGITDDVRELKQALGGVPEDPPAPAKP